MEAIIREAEVIEALRSCFDPEIPVNIYELGLIYDVKVDPSGAVVHLLLYLFAGHGRSTPSVRYVTNGNERLL